MFSQAVVFLSLSLLALPILDIARVLAPAAFLWVIYLAYTTTRLFSSAASPVTTKKLLQEFARRLVDTGGWCLRNGTDSVPELRLITARAPVSSPVAGSIVCVLRGCPVDCR